MRLAVSNIAWPAGADETAASILREHGATGVEIAPTKIWPKPLEATDDEVRAYRRWWEDRSLPIVAMQALLFGRPDLTIFPDPATRRATTEYLKGILSLAGTLGAGALVFGSPKNRLVGDLPPERIEQIAVPFFRELGEHAVRCGTCLCIEPNPPQYGCDWITTAEQARDLVQRVGTAGFGLHLDTGGAAFTHDNLFSQLGRVGRACESHHFASPHTKVGLAGSSHPTNLSQPTNTNLDRLRHFHVSEPFLRPITAEQVPHAELSAALHAKRYEGWISIEMSEQQFQQPWTTIVAESIAFVRSHYSSSADYSDATRLPGGSSRWQPQEAAHKRVSS